MRLAARIRSLEQVAKRTRVVPPDRGGDVMRAVRTCPATALMVVGLRARASARGWDREADEALRAIDSRVERLRELGWPEGGLGDRP